MLTLENVNKPSQDRLSLADLPKTICDAVEITYELAIDYLWVDSMCIIQDSDEDKREQLSQMHRIMLQAHVTLVALESSVEQGLFRSSSGTADLRLVVLHSGGREGTILLHEHDVRLDGRESAEHRAWTHEERMLSPRKLIFSDHMFEVGWSCSKQKMCINHNVWVMSNVEAQAASTRHRRTEAKESFNQSRGLGGMDDVE